MAPEGQMLPAIALPGVTLAAVDTRSPNLALQAMRRCMEGLAFGRCVLLTDLPALLLPQCRDTAPPRNPRAPVLCVSGPVRRPG